MKYDIILTNKEVENILNIKYSNYGEVIQKLKEQFNDFDLRKSKKSQYIFEIAISINGCVSYNDKERICPNCKGKYVVRTYCGDIYYRLFNGSRNQRKIEKRRFEKMGLYCNPWASGNGSVREYWCLNCATRWNGKEENIINDYNVFIS